MGFPWAVENAATANDQEFVTVIAWCGFLFAVHGLTYALILATSKPLGVLVSKSNDPIHDVIRTQSVIEGISKTIQLNGTFKVRETVDILALYPSQNLSLYLTGRLPRAQVYYATSAPDGREVTSHHITLVPKGTR